MDEWRRGQSRSSDRNRQTGNGDGEALVRQARTRVPSRLDTPWQEPVQRTELAALGLPELALAERLVRLAARTRRRERPQQEPIRSEIDR